MSDGALYVDSGGQLRPLAPEQVAEAEGLGWTPATPEQAQAHALQQKYGDVSGQLKAGAAGLARGLSLGLSDPLLTKTGLVAPETLKGLEEANPLASGVGQAVGIAAPLVLTAGAAAPAEGALGAARGAAALTAPALAARAGRAVTGAVADGLPEASGLLGQIVSKAVASGAGSAIEGAAYGAGQDVSEAALGDHNLTAQSLLAHTGLMAALGGGLGAIVGAGEVAVPALFKGATESLASAAVAAREAYPEIAERMTGGAVSADMVREAQAKYAAAFKDPRDVVRLQKDLGGALEDVANQVEDAKRTMYTHARPVETEHLLAGQDPTVLAGNAAQARDKVLGVLSEAITEARADPDLVTGKVVGEIEKIRDGFARRTAGVTESPLGLDVGSIEHPLDVASSTRLVPLAEGPAKSVKIPTWLSPEEFTAEQKAWDWTWAALGGPDAPEPAQRLVFHHMRKAFTGAAEDFSFGANAADAFLMPDEHAIRQGFAAARLSKGLGGRRFAPLRERIDQWARLPADARPADPIPEGAWGSLIDTTGKDIAWGEGNKFGDVQKVDAINKWIRQTQYDLDPAHIKVGTRTVNWYTHEAAPPLAATAPVATTGPKALDVFENLRTARRQLDDLGAWSKINRDLPPLAQGNAVKMARGLRGAVRDVLTDESAWGPAAARQAALDDLNSAYMRSFKTLTGGKLGPLNANILPKAMIEGREQFQLNPRALRTALNQMGDPRGERVATAVFDYLDAAGKYVNGMEESYRHLPTSNFDKDALTGLIGKTETLVDQAHQQAAATRFLNDLNPDAGLGSGGAKALLPQASNAGTMGGLGAVALAPVVGHMIPGAGPVVAAYGAAKAGYHLVQGMKNVPQMVATLANLERVTQKITGAIDAGASTLVRGSVKAGYVGRGETMAGIAREFAAGPQESVKRFNRRVVEIQRLSSDPDALQKAIVQQNAGLDEHAPNTSQALAIASARGVSFLASKLPQQPQRGPLAPKYEPTQSQVSKFARYYEAVQDPLVILKQAAAGTLTREAVEAVQVVYPELFARIRTGLVDKLAGHAESIPSRSRLMLTALLGQDVDGSLSMVAVNQAVHQQRNAAKQQQGRAINPTSQGMGRISVSDRSLTPMQHAAQRRI